MTEILAHPISAGRGCNEFHDGRLRSISILHVGTDQPDPSPSPSPNLTPTLWGLEVDGRAGPLRVLIVFFQKTPGRPKGQNRSTRQTDRQTDGRPSPNSLHISLAFRPSLTGTEYVLLGRPCFIVENKNRGIVRHASSPIKTGKM